MSNNGYSKYKQTSVTTASKGQVLVMLYEGAIKHTRFAIEAIKENNLSRKGESILKVHDIVNELSLALNHDVGGQISKDLERLYIFIVDQLTEANLKNATKPLEDALKILETLHEGWQGALKQIAKFGGDPASAAAAEMGGQVNTTPEVNDASATREKSAAKSAFTMSTLVGAKPVGSK